MPIESILEGVTLKDIIYFTIGGVGIISAIIEKTNALPFHPWSNLFKWLGKMLTHDLADKLDVLDEQQQTNTKAIEDLDKKVDKKFEEKQKDDDEKEAKRLRASIIDFVDSCRCDNKHTQNRFEDIMRAYDDYIALCKKQGIPNHYIDSEYKYIEGLYHERLRNNDFL